MTASPSIEPRGSSRTGKETLETVIRSMIAARAPGATVCPSEVARMVSAQHGGSKGAGWRRAMPDVHAEVDRLLSHGVISISWKGRQIDRRAGPYRIGRP